MTSTKFVLTLAVTGGGLKAAVIVGWYLTKSPALYWMAGAWDPVVTWAAGRLADYWVPTGYGQGTQGSPQPRATQPTTGRLLPKKATRAGL